MSVLQDGSGGRAAVHASSFAELLACRHAGVVVREFVLARPKERAGGAFSFGRSRTVIEGACAAHGLPVRFAMPPILARDGGFAPGKDDAKDIVISYPITGRKAAHPRFRGTTL
jgi:hypothetical protein